MDDQVRELLRNIAEDIPPQREVPSTLRPRARRRMAATVTMSAVVVGAMALGGLAVARSITRSSLPPAGRGQTVQPAPRPAAPGTFAYALDGDVYVANPDGSNAVKIADGRSAADCYGWSGEYWAEGPMWSPDGRFLAFRRYTECGNDESPTRNVVISDADGSVLAEFPAAGWRIGWSPDSNRVAVWDDFPEKIGVYGLDGSRLAELTTPPWWNIPGDVDPGWSPDGASVTLPSMGGRVVEFPLDGGTPRMLQGPPSDPAGDPDGFDIGVEHGALKLARTDGSGSVTLVPAERGTDLEGIAVSPTGDRVLFSKSKDGTSSLWSIGVDGSDPRLLVEGTAQGEWLFGS